jgi:hypothetical protein
MRTIWLFGLLILAFAVIGTSAAEIPDMVGVWAGSGPGYNERAGYAEGGATFNITEQNGRIFAGELTYQLNGTDVVEGFAGAIGSDDKSLYVAEFISGYDLGTVISEDEIELIYLQDGEPAEVFMQTFSRVEE